MQEQEERRVCLFHALGGQDLSALRMAFSRLQQPFAKLSEHCVRAADASGASQQKNQLWILARLDMERYLLLSKVQHITGSRLIVARGQPGLERCFA